MSIEERSDETCDPGAGIPGVASEHGAAIASFIVDAPGKRARAFHAAPASAGEALHVDAGRPREATREWGDLAGERGVLVRGD